MIAVVGAAGQVGAALCGLLGTDAVPLTRADVDLTDLAAIEPALAARRPEVVVNCAAYNAVDRAESEPDFARAVNELAVEAMAYAARRIDAGFVTLSTDYVFDGEASEPYVESSTPRPLGVYGATKLAGEQRALAAHPGAVVVRTAWVQSGMPHSFASRIVAAARRGPVRVATDQVSTPTNASDLARTLLDAIRAGATGLLHLANQPAVSRFELASDAMRFAGLDPGLVHPAVAADFPGDATRPAYSALASERLDRWGIDPLPDYRPGLQEALAQPS